MKKLRAGVVSAVLIVCVLGFCASKSLLFSDKEVVKFHNVFNLAKAHPTDFQNSEADDFIEIEKSFTFLGNGCQSVAFESSDKKYVLKFFTVNPFFEGLRLKKRKANFFWGWKKDLKRKRRLESVLRNYSLIFKSNMNLAGLVFVRLNLDEKKLPDVLLHWPDDSSVIVNLSDYFFVIQKKADLVVDALKNLDSLQEREIMLRNMRAFLVQRAKLGFRDKKRTMSMHMNYGFFKGNPMQFDVGNVMFDSKVLEDPKDEIAKVVELFDSWVEKNQGYLGF